MTDRLCKRCKRKVPQNEHAAYNGSCESGLCRLWNEPGAFERAREMVGDLCPTVAPYLGKAVKQCPSA